MSQPEEFKFSANIVLLGYSAVTTLEFQDKFKSIEKLDDLKEFNFSKDQLKVEFDGNIPESLKDKFIPILKYTDSIKEISVEYLDLDKKLQIHDYSLSNIDLFEKLAKILVEEQSSKITAMGFNFECECISQTQNAPVITATEKALTENTSFDRDLESLEIRFSYTEKDYKKSFKIEKSKPFSVLANYHYDKLKDENSTSRIRESIIKQIDQNYRKFLREFQELSKGVVKA